MAGAKSFGLPRIAYPISFSDITMTSSPALLGRYSAGAGPAQQIPVVSPFQISATEISVQAAAQYNVFGRKTAGAGAMEDCTRVQLNIAGTDLSNTFSQQQIISYAASGLTPLNPASCQLEIINTDGGASGAIINGYHNSATPANNDTPLRVQAFGNNSAGNTIRYGRFAYSAINVAAGAEQGEIVFEVINAGVLLTGMKITTGVYVGNTTDPGYGSLGVQYVLKTGVFTVATLPAAAASGAGARCYVTDALAPAFGAAVAGGGAVGMVVFSTGAAWNVG